jgi:positive regulator of sigma E activity
LTMTEVGLMEIRLDLISLILGTVLGVNLVVLYERFFRKASNRERILQQRVRELERRLKEKDRLIAKAVKTVAQEHEASQ